MNFLCPITEVGLCAFRLAVLAGYRQTCKTVLIVVGFVAQRHKKRRFTVPTEPKTLRLGIPYIKKKSKQIRKTMNDKLLMVITNS